jgi:nicotinate-nucleotide adenylyltransferase
MPTGRPVAKPDRVVTDAEHRYLMTVLATASNPDFDVSRLEIDRPGPTYTVDTMTEMRGIHGPSAALYFITGADAVWEILTWKDAGRLAELTRLIAATRPGYDLSRFQSAHAQSKRRIPEVEFMEVPALAISSTDIRERVSARRPIRYLLPEAVSAYVAKNRLYRENA